MRIFRLLLVLALALPAAGCLESATVVRVERDGSGSIEKSLAIRTEFLGQIRAAARQILFLEEPSVTCDLFDGDNLGKGAASLGEGVSLLKAQRVSDGRVEGYRATYSFRDIRTVRIPVAAGFLPAGAQGRFLSFDFSRGKGSRLLIRQGGEEPAVSALLPVIGEEVADGALRGMKFSLAVLAAGEVTSSNARYREESRVTLVDIDFGRIAASASPAGGEAAVPGFRIDRQREIVVEFL